MAEASAAQQVVQPATAGQHRRRWTACRKMEVVLEGLSGKSSVVELCRKHGISQSMYYEWKESALAKMEEGLTYGGRTKREYDQDRQIGRLERKIGELTMTVEILKKTAQFDARRGSTCNSYGGRESR